MRTTILGLGLLLGASCGVGEETTSVGLPSWQGEAEVRLTEFIAASADEGSAGFIPVAERIAVFDNDGTLWSEQPMYAQLVFAVDRMHALSAEHPEWQEDEVLAAGAAGDIEAVFSHGGAAIFKIMVASHAGMTAAEFDLAASSWIAEARHPGSGRPYTEMVYQPMLELIDHLHANDWQVWIVSGGGVAFMRSWAEEVYEIPPERIIGSRMKSRFEMRDDGPVIMREGELGFLDDNVYKPIGIYEQIGRRPRLAFGNSDGDLQMLQWTMAGDGPRFAGIVHHTDAEREVAYDRDSHIGRLDEAMDQARADGWLLVDMATGWKTIYPPQ